ncbi:MAG: MBOAT family protein [Myxococcota bacterium]
MIFNSLDYLIFFTLVASVHFLLPTGGRWPLLLVASYGFYMAWNPAYLFLILCSTAVDFLLGQRMAEVDEPVRRRLLLFGSLAANFGLLFTFKYWNFAQANLDRLLTTLGTHSPIPPIDVLLPVGISFYTFQTLSYTIDIYRGVLRPEPHLGRFALYVAFFPQLVAGPIERARNLLPQLREEASFDWERIESGVQLMLWGLFKKVVIADRVAIYVDAVYGNVGQHNPGSYLLATYLFAVQIYCDFSGYSDIAIGSAKVLGYDLMKNFERPYFSKSMTEFWRRWHISLSTWLRDYLYITLGGNRYGLSKTYRNLLITMVLGGLWHGASWNFVIWGALHGVLLGLSRATLPARDQIYARFSVPTFVRDAWRMIATFHLACLGWIFFRADTLETAWMILSGILSGPLSAPFRDTTTLAHALLAIPLMLLVHVIQERAGSARAWLADRPVAIRWACWYAMIVAIALMGVDGGAQFIYFQF